MTFRGGMIDDNIVSFYDYLTKIGALPTKSVNISGKDLESTLLGENVLFAYYPNELNDLIARLNRGNHDLRLKGSPTQTKNPFVFQPEAPVVVPDLKFDKYSYLEVLHLDGQPLQSVASQRHLYRGFDPSSKHAISLSMDQAKQQELVRLNPKSPTDNLLKMSEGRVVFPADGFVTRLRVPADLVGKVLAFTRSNVYVTVAAAPKLKSFGMSTLANPRAEADPADLTCPEPLSPTFNKHLASVSYELPKGFGQNEVDFPSIVVLDRFPPVSAEKLAERQYVNELKTYFENDNAISAAERKVLEVERADLKISPARAVELENIVKERLVSAKRYDLSEHLEFQDGALKVPPQVIDEADEKAVAALDETDHGLHVAAIIGARCNGYGIAGMVPFAPVVAYSIGKESDGGVLPHQALIDLGTTLDCGSKPCVINASWTYGKNEIGPEFIEDVRKLSEEYLVVAAAGDKNGSPGAGGEMQGGALTTPCDLVPACLGDLPNVITVSSFLANNTELLDPRANYTDGGLGTVALAAPGDHVLSAVRGSKFFTLSGTSQATAFVTGAAALLSVADHRLAPRDIKNRLLYTADLDYNYGGKVAFGRLDVKRALEYHSDDAVFLGNVPKRGVFDYAIRPTSQNVTRAMFLYRRGRENDQVTDCRVSRVRRIFKNPGGSYYTVVYEALDGKSLKVEREVSFFPDGKPEHAGVRLTDSFRLVTCTIERKDDSIPMRDWVAKCPRASQRTEQIDLRQVHDLIVRADVGLR